MQGTGKFYTAPRVQVVDDDVTLGKSGNDMRNGNDEATPSTQIFRVERMCLL